MILRSYSLILLLLVGSLSASAAFQCRFLPWRKNLHPQILQEWLRLPKAGQWSRLGSDFEGELPSDALSNQIQKDIMTMLARHGASHIELQYSNIQNPSQIRFFLSEEQKFLRFPDEIFPTRLNYQAFEVALPIMNNRHELEIAFDSLRIFKEAGALPGRYAGFHIHLDSQRLQNIEFLVFVELMRLVWNEFKPDWHYPKERNMYLRLYNREQLSHLLAKPATLLDARSLLDWLALSEGYFVEYSPYLQTVEVRFPTSSFESERVYEYFLWTKGIYDAVRNREPWLVEILQRRGKLQLRDFRPHLKLQFPSA